MTEKLEQKEISKKIKTYLSYASRQPKGFAYSERPKKIMNTTTQPQTKQEKLDALKKQYSSCTTCPLATQGRSQVVFGHGNPDAVLMFVGEGPGRDEDEQGIPFIGRAGQLLNKIMQAMGIDRKDVYISNIVKCRPPGNRTPLPNESAICKPLILEKEIAIVKPKMICTLGTVATQELLGTQVSITKARGTFYNYNNIPVLPTYHPAYLLRNPEKKTEVWQDMKLILGKLPTL